MPIDYVAICPDAYGILLYVKIFPGQKAGEDPGDQFSNLRVFSCSFASKNDFYPLA